jgi:putative SOS response-associated peptidase YedK
MFIAKMLTINSFLPEQKPVKSEKQGTSSINGQSTWHASDDTEICTNIRSENLRKKDNFHNPVTDEKAILVPILNKYRGSI